MRHPLISAIAELLMPPLSGDLKDDRKTGLPLRWGTCPLSRVLIPDSTGA
ncbi:MAG: hypothetical protein JJ879_15065 [Sneathiella sp.]|nr:hypothetical protein [Sneathiella sp.]